jgi:hypothetical protein
MTDIATIIIAVIVAYIGFLQYQTNKRQQLVNEDKLRLDLFDKRFKVFDDTRELFQKAYSTVVGPIDKQAIHEFNIMTIDALFLFDENISEYLELAQIKANRFNSIYTQCKNLPIGTQRDKLYEEKGEIGEWFVGGHSNLQTLFSSYLSFELSK